MPIVAEILKKQLVTKTGKTVTEVAQEIGMSRPAFSNVINGSSDLSIELALKLEAMFVGIDATKLLVAQLKEKIDQARSHGK